MKLASQHLQIVKMSLKRHDINLGQQLGLTTIKHELDSCMKALKRWSNRKNYDSYRILYMKIKRLEDAQQSMIADSMEEL